MRRILSSSILKWPHKIADFCTQVSGRRWQLQGPSSVMATSRWLGGARKARAWLIPSLRYLGVVDHEKVLEILACDGKVFTENSLGTELRATTEEHLEHLGAKPLVLQRRPHPINILNKADSNYLHSNTEYQPPNPSWMFSGLCCVWNQSKDLASDRCSRWL